MADPVQYKKNTATQTLSKELTGWRKTLSSPQSQKLIVTCAFLTIVVTVLISSFVYRSSQASYRATPVQPTEIPAYTQELPNTPGSAIWSLTPGTFPPEEEQKLQTAVTQSIELQGIIPGGEILDVDKARTEGNVIVLYGTLRYADGAPIITEPVMFLASKDGTEWRITTVEDASFCNIFRQIPFNRLLPSEQIYFSPCQQQLF